jgi:hypothetical protein
MLASIVIDDFVFLVLAVIHIRRDYSSLPSMLLGENAGL